MAVQALFIPALIGSLAVAMGTMAGRVLISLGFGFITYKGLDVGVNALKQMAVTSLMGLPADMIGLIGFLWIDKALTVIFSAISTALAMRLLGGSMKRLVAK